MSRVLAISGSLRSDSHNTRLLRAAQGLAPDGVEIEIYEDLRSVPPYDEDIDNGDPPAEAENLRAAIAAADGLLIATPEYNGSIPGQLKNAIDWASRPRAEAALRGKPSAVVGASPGQFGAIWAQADARKVLKTAGARVIETDLPVAQVDQAIDGAGELVDETIAARYVEILAELMTEIERDREAARARDLIAA